MNRSQLHPAHLLLALALATPSPAASDTKPIPPGRPATPTPVRPPLVVDEPGDGSIWVRGEHYKAGFDRSGAVFVPFLGSQASENRPLALSPRAATSGGLPLAFARDVAPAREPGGVAFERGAFVERYRAEPGSVEQVFVFDTLPDRGELVLVIEAETPLAPREIGTGLRFESDLGGVEYSRAVAIDASGRRLDLATRARDGAIEIRVPAAFLAEAALPLVVDPVITTYAIDTTAFDDFAPDLAWDASLGVTLAVFEEAYSATDHDVYAYLIDASGAFLSGQYVDITVADHRHPRTANNEAADQFMVASHGGTAGNRSIVTRTFDATTYALGAVVVPGPAHSGWERLNPDIGGNPAPTGDTRYMVVYEQHHVATGERWIVQSLMNADGQPNGGAPICIDCNPGKRFRPAVSKSAGAVGSGVDNRWNVVWEYEFAAGDRDIYGAQLANASQVFGPFSINTSFLDDHNPTVSSFADQASPPGRYLVAWHRDDPILIDTDIHGAVLDGASLIASANLSVLEGPAFDQQDQLFPDADSDGCVFAVAYSELYSTSDTDWDVYVSTFAFAGGAIDVLEPHVNLAYTSQPDVDVQVAATRGALAPMHQAAWTHQKAPGDSDVQAAIYVSPTIAAYCFPGVDGVAACPCANPGQASRGCQNSAATGGALLAGAGDTSLANDALTLTQTGELASSLSIVLQGNSNVAAGVAFGGGIRCAGGSLKRLYVRNAVAGTVSVPAGGDPSVSAASAALGDVIPPCGTRYYQVYYRDPNVGFCPAGYNVGNALKVLWLP